MKLPKPQHGQISPIWLCHAAMPAGSASVPPFGPTASGSVSTPSVGSGAGGSGSSGGDGAPGKVRSAFEGFGGFRGRQWQQCGGQLCWKLAVLQPSGICASACPALSAIIFCCLCTQSQCANTHKPGLSPVKMAEECLLSTCNAVKWPEKWQKMAENNKRLAQNCKLLLCICFFQG